MPKTSLFFIIAMLTLGIWSVLAYGRVGMIRSAMDTQSDQTILVVGDVMLGRSVNANIRAQRDPSWPFRHVGAVLSQADLTLGNLESPLVTDCPETREGMIFCGDLQNADGLRAAGFDLMSTANNHAENYGVQGLRQTQHVLGVNGITAFGDPVVGTYQLGGSRLAILGFDDVSRHLDLRQVASVVRRTADSGALTLVYFHWGQEYQAQESARQRELAHVSIEAGAAAVIGAHPHVIQGSEWYQGKPIYYSLGNFVFDQEWSRETKQGLAIRLHLRDSQITRVDELPMLIQSYGQPTWLPGVLR